MLFLSAVFNSASVLSKASGSGAGNAKSGSWGVGFDGDGLAEWADGGWLRRIVSSIENAHELVECGLR